MNGCFMHCESPDSVVLRARRKRLSIDYGRVRLYSHPVTPQLFGNRG